MMKQPKGIHLLRRTDQIVSGILLFGIQAYQRYLSPWLGTQCRFYPTCSNYAYDAINKYGFLCGSRLACMRICKCHPWHPGGHDPLP